MQSTQTTRTHLLLTSFLAVASVGTVLGCDVETLDDPEDEVPFESADNFAPEAEPEAPHDIVEDDGMIVVEGDDFRVRIHRTRRVAELNVSRDQAADWYPKPFPRWSMEATQRLYEVFEDDFDFIVFAPASEGQHPAITLDGDSVRVSNEVAGLGLELFDDSAQYGSAGRLQSTVMLGGMKHVTGGPILRELGERWGNAFVPTASPNHWGFADVGGQLGGCSPDTIDSIGEDIWVCSFDGGGNWSPDGATHTDRPYARLELYLMGLIGHEGIPAITWADDGEWIDRDLGMFRGTLRHSDIGGLIDTHGERVPGVGQAQTEFRTLFVVISAGDLLDLPTFHGFEARVAEFAAPGPVLGEPGMLNFHEAASGLATLDVEQLDASLL